MLNLPRSLAVPARATRDPVTVHFGHAVDAIVSVKWGYDFEDRFFVSGGVTPVLAADLEHETTLPRVLST